jgi:TRAP-type C4-dicarboxylate transport system substrate-binding protein
MSVRSILRGATITLALAGTMGLAGTAVADEWKCYTYQSAPASPVVKGLEMIGEKLNEITDGEVNVTCNVGGSLPIDANSIAPAMTDGVLHFGSVSNISGYVPLAAIGILPGLFSSNAEYDEKGWPILKEVIQAEFDKRNLKVLGTYHYPPQVVWGSKSAEPLKTLDGLAGKTLRVGNPEVGEFAKAFGAIPVTLPTPDVAPALQRGTVDYVITAAAAGGRLWRDFFGSGILDQVFVATSYIVVNKDKFDSLTPEQQAEFEQYAAETGRWITETQENDDAVAIKEFQENDGWVITPKSPESYAEITRRVSPVWDKWAEERGPEAVELLGKLKTALGHDKM